MRTVLRLLLFWAITAPLFYVYGLPWLLSKLDAKAQAQSYSSCMQHLADEHLIGGPGWVIKQADGETYCHCVSGGLHFTRADLPELLQKKTPERIATAMKPMVEACNSTLKASMNSTIQTAPEPHIERKPDGTEIIHFN
ncbi:MAG: hypothetical protein ACKVOE_09535 [Rickettsiales bacterium]